MTSTWEAKDVQHRDQYECKFNQYPSLRHDIPSILMMSSQRYQLMDETIQPITHQPLLTSKSERFTYITLDTVATKHHHKVNILYVANENNLIKKISILPRTIETCTIEIWEPEINVDARILTIQFLKHTESLYVGMENGIMRIPAQHCSRHSTQSNCMNAMDPYCGWNGLLKKCTTAPDGDPLTRFWSQSSNECPDLNAATDGGWSAWSEWFKCSQHIDDHHFETSTNHDSCLCRSRLCDNPAPKNGGKQCHGIKTQVTNCTVNGGWTEWSSWSACSQTCGMGKRIILFLF